MSGVGKALKKVVKGVGKVAKGIVKGIAKVGKKLVKGIGKVMGKLGPIGTMAIAFIAPYALPALAGAGIPVLSSVAKGVMAVNSAIAAPFKALGKFVGAGVSKGGAALAKTIGVDTAVGKGISSITTKLAANLGYDAAGGSVMNQMKSVFTDVGAKFGDAFGVEGYGTPDFSKVSATEAGGINPENQQYQQLYEQEVGLTDRNSFLNPESKPLLQPETTNALETSAGYEQSLMLTEQNMGFGAETETLADKAMGAAKSGLTNLFGTPQGYSLPEFQPIEDPGGPGSQVGAVGPQGEGYGGQGRSFYAQDQTGLMTTEDFVNKSFSLLGRTARGLA